ncbi:MAG: cytochrome c family protein [Pseudomonadota bacterium]
MDTMEINKVIGALVGALLVYLGVQFFAQALFEGEHGGDHKYSYAIELETDDGAGDDAPAMDLPTLLASADASRGERVFAKCKACHKVNGEDGTGPHLNGVVGRGIGAVAGFGYSGALSATGEEAWTPEALFAFLENPKSWAPGTSMGFAGLRKPEDRAALIAWLEQTEG